MACGAFSGGVRALQHATARQMVAREKREAVFGQLVEWDIGMRRCLVPCNLVVPFGAAEEIIVSCGHAARTNCFVGHGMEGI